MLGQFAEEVWIRAAQNTERLSSRPPNPQMAIPAAGENGHLFRNKKLKVWTELQTYIILHIYCISIYRI